MADPVCNGCKAMLDLTDSAPTLLRCPQCAMSFASVLDPSLKAASPQDPDPMRRLPIAPELTSRWDLVDPLGRGAFGVVYRGRCKADNSTVAIKFLARTHDDGVLARFLKEGELLSKIDNKNVIRVLANGHSGGCPYIVTEFVDGGTLRDEMRSSAINVAPKRVCQIAIECLNGLSALHQCGIVHRDLKPENILRTRVGEVKLADLGIAKDYSVEVGVTQTGAMIGTPRYMAPEQIRGEPTTVASDLYSLGLILFEMLAGRHPFQKFSLTDLIMFATGQGEVPRLSDAAPWVPSSVAAAVQSALARRPGDRPGSAQELADRLSHAVHAMKSQQIQSAAPESRNMPSDRTGGPSFMGSILSESVGFALGLFLLGALGLFVIWHVMIWLG